MPRPRQSAREMITGTKRLLEFQAPTGQGGLTHRQLVRSALLLYGLYESGTCCMFDCSMLVWAQPAQCQPAAGTSCWLYRPALLTIIRSFPGGERTHRHSISTYMLPPAPASVYSSSCQSAAPRPSRPPSPPAVWRLLFFSGRIATRLLVDQDYHAGKWRPNCGGRLVKSPGKVSPAELFRPPAEPGCWHCLWVTRLVEQVLQVAPPAAAGCSPQPHAPPEPSVPSKDAPSSERAGFLPHAGTMVMRMAPDHLSSPRTPGCKQVRMGRRAGRGGRAGLAGLLPLSGAAVWSTRRAWRSSNFLRPTCKERLQAAMGI